MLEPSLRVRAISQFLGRKYFSVTTVYKLEPTQSWDDFSLRTASQLEQIFLKLDHFQTE